jgi:hypothetical protein
VKRKVLCKCGGGPTHHTLEPECWCPNCLRLPIDQRCTEFDGVVEQAGDPQHWRGRGRTIPGNRVRMIPRAGTLKKEIWDLCARHNGCTDDDLEFLTGRSHQSVSAARNDLMNDGLVVDSGMTKMTRWGNTAIVWKRGEA